MIHYNRNMNQSCWLRRRTGRIDRYGQPEFCAPEDHICRWQGEQNLFVNLEGEQFTSKAVVYMPTDVQQGDRLSMGGTELEIRAVVRTPSLRGGKILIKAVL